MREQNLTNGDGKNYLIVTEIYFNAFKEKNLDIIAQKMELNCEFIISIRKKYASVVQQSFEDLRCLTIKEVTE